MITNWEISLGLYPGILFGFRSYPAGNLTSHVLYVPFIDVCLIIEREADE